MDQPWRHLCGKEAGPSTLHGVSDQGRVTLEMSADNDGPCGAALN